MVKITLDLPEGLHRILAIEAVAAGVSIEAACVQMLRDTIEVRFELPEYYNNLFEQIYKKRGIRKAHRKE